MSPILGQAIADAEGCDEGRSPTQEPWSWAASPAHRVGWLLTGSLGLLWLPAPGRIASSNQISRQSSLSPVLAASLSQNSPDSNPRQLRPSVPHPPRGAMQSEEREGVKGLSFSSLQRNGGWRYPSRPQWLQRCLWTPQEQGHIHSIPHCVPGSEHNTWLLVGAHLAH